MAEKLVYIAFPRELYEDIIRFSDGEISPEILASDLVENWVRNSVEWDSPWGDRTEAVALKYAEHVYDKWMQQANEGIAARAKDILPLVWKEVTVAAGSEVRMTYGGNQHYAKVRGGKIVDDDGAYSPSEWASKVAGGTSRNAWRDLWFKQPFASSWVPAQMLRDQAKAGEG